MRVKELIRRSHEVDSLSLGIKEGEKEIEREQLRIDLAAIVAV